MTAKTRAEKSAAAMWADDQASKWAGMGIERVDEGSAALALTVWDVEATLDAAFFRALDFLDSGRAHDHLQSLIS